MNKESLFLIKPDEQSPQIAQKALEIATGLNLAVILMGEKVLSLEEAETLYQRFKSEEWFPRFMEYLTSGEVGVYLARGEEAIRKINETKRQIREKYAHNRQQNAIHAPKTVEDAKKDINFFQRIFK